MGIKKANKTIERLTAYWEFHRRFDANIKDLAAFTRVSRDTVYRWLKGKSYPKEQKLKLIEQWLNQKTTQ